MLDAWVNVNGSITPPFSSVAETPASAKVSVFDRGFLYGDSLYEVVRTYGRRPFKMRAHLERLVKSAELCRLDLGHSLETFEREMRRTLDKFFEHQPKGSQNEAYIRIIVTRGAGKIGFGLGCVQTPAQFVIIVQKLDIPSEELLTKGYRYQVSSRWRNPPQALDPAMKSGNYLNSLLGYLEATESKFGQDGGPDYDDALLCDYQGFMTEGTTFNIFYVKRGIVVTAPLDVGILDGITRKHVLGLCEKLDIPYRVARFPKERLYEADEVFMSSTIKEAFPVTQIDRKKIASGKPGPITLKLRKAFFETLSEGLE